MFLVVKGFDTLYWSVVQSSEIIQTRGCKRGGRLHGADMSPKLIFIGEILAILVRGR